MPSYTQNLKETFGLKYDVKDIGQRIKKLREKQKMSVNFLAQKSRIDYGMLLRAESGKHEPMLSTLLRIIHGLNIQPAEFFEGFG